MTYRVVILPRAERDIQSAARYISAVGGEGSARLPVLRETAPRRTSPSRFEPDRQVRPDDDVDLGCGGFKRDGLLAEPSAADHSMAAKAKPDVVGGFRSPDTSRASFGWYESSWDSRTFGLRSSWLAHRYKGVFMNQSWDCHSLIDFQSNSSELLAQLKQTRQPVVLTVDGQPEFVVQDTASYQKLLDQAERLATIEAIREGLASIERGEGRPADEFFDELKAELMAKGDA